MTPFFSIVTVTRNDVWSLTKTARSVFRQKFKNFEYIILDGASSDATGSLAKFWQSNGLVSRFVSEPDTGVYNAMNKGVRLANGKFVCLLNAGDVFAADDVLEKLFSVLSSEDYDGVLGWGELNGQIWASWAEHEAFKLASLGFCHQSLFVKRDILLKEPFDERPFKTDSDTRQLGRLYERGSCIKILREVLAIRGGEPGISANLERTKASIVNTLTEEYGITQEVAERILQFRRTCSESEYFTSLVESASGKLRHHLAYMVLDTLFLRQSTKLSSQQADQLFECAYKVLHESEGSKAQIIIENLVAAQTVRQSLMDSHTEANNVLRSELAEFQKQEDKRLEKLIAERNWTPNLGDFIVSLTSFPARIPCLHHVIRSLVEQTLRPREIHLWLGADEIPNRNWLPKALLKFEEQGLRIHFAPRTFHQYDKFLHNSELNRDTPFVIVDDDVIYPPNSMEILLKTHKAYPDAVVANRAHMMSFLPSGDLAPYSSWKREIEVQQPSLLAFPTGAGGVLYPKGFLSDPTVTQTASILACAPYADDVWLKVCALVRGVPTMTTPLSKGANWYLRYTPTMKAGALHATNVDLGLNDMQVRQSFDWLSQRKPAWRSEITTKTVGAINED